MSGAKKMEILRENGWCTDDEADTKGIVDSNLTRIVISCRNPVEVVDGDFNCCNTLNSGESCG